MNGLRDRDYVRDKTLVGQQVAAAKGYHGSRLKVTDDRLTFALALHAKGAPVPASRPSAPSPRVRTRASAPPVASP